MRTQMFGLMVCLQLAPLAPALAQALPEPEAKGSKEAAAPAEPERAATGTMVDIPAGGFQMGSDSSEANANEQPVHTVQVAAFRMMQHEVTLGQFRQFVTATGYQTEAERDVGVAGCYSETATGEFAYVAGRSYADPGFAQDESHPVVCVSWNDAVAYAEWLSQETGQRFRLPTEAEWEYAARAGETGARPATELEMCTHGNVADRQAQTRWSAWTTHNCDDGWVWAAPVGSFQPNRFGLHDMLGNVWEWTADCWNDSYAGAPGDGSAWTAGDCELRVYRGGGWGAGSAGVRLSFRYRYDASGRNGGQGFRLVQDP